jgi:hypothetical protein
VVKNEIINYVAQKKKEKAGQISRDIDATTFEQAIDLATHPSFYDKYFKPALVKAYPLGREETRLFLTRLKDIRNDLAHGRGCTARQLERAICYTNDLTDSLKDYFRSISMQRDYDVPMIVRYVDNRGNESHLEGVPTNINNRIIDWRRSGRGDLYPGDTLVAEVEVDQSFDPSEYNVSRQAFGFGREGGRIARFLIDNRFVGEQMELSFEVVSKRDWHRQHGLDDRLSLIFRVLPPPK